MANVLSEEKRQQVIALGQLSFSLRRIEDATGIHRETAGKYLRAAGIAIRPPGQWGHGKAAIEVSTGSVADTAANPAIEASTGSRNKRQQSLCEEYREELLAGLSKGRCAKVLWEDLVTEKGFIGGYSSVKRFMLKLRAELADDCEPVGVIETEPGYEAQVDYGEGPLAFDPNVGRYRGTRLFVLTLGWSRKCVRLLTFASSALIWAGLHERAFRRLGGSPRVVVNDNLAEGVKVADFTDPVLNVHFAAVLAHHGSVAVPARVRDPDRKGKVERGVGHAQLRFKGSKFESLDEAQAWLDSWEERFADTRIHGTTKRQVREMFLEEKKHLKPLPLEPWRRITHAKRKVSATGHVEVEGSYYEAPPALLDSLVPVQFDEHIVRIIHPQTGQLVVEHSRTQTKGTRIPRKESEARRASSALDEILKAAARAGPSVGKLCCAVANDNIEELAQRRIRAVLRLAQKHSAEYVDKVCAIALHAGAPTHRFVRTYLEHHPPVPLALKQVDPLIRDLLAYRDVVARLTSTTQETA